MDFHAIEARRNGVCCCFAETVHDARQFLEFERARLRDIREAIVDEGLGFSPDRRRRNRRSAVFLKVDVADTADMPELQEIRPPLACTADVTLRQPSIWARE